MGLLVLLCNLEKGAAGYWGNMSNISCPNYDMTTGGLQSDPDLGEVVAWA